MVPSIVVPLKQQTVSYVFNFYLCFHSTNTICRGLVVDKQRGNILKIDRHKSVRKAVHGSMELTTEQRKAIYNKEIFSFSEDNFVNIDTVHLAIGMTVTSFVYAFVLQQLIPHCYCCCIEALLFVQLVDLQRTTAALQAYAFHDLYRYVSVYDKYSIF